MIKKILFVLLAICMFCGSAFAKDDFYGYLKNIKYETEKAWNPPVYYLKHTSEVYFRVNKDGSISNIKLSKSSKVPQLDERAVETVKKLPKFGKLPSYYIGEFIEITVSLTNYVYEDLRNPNIYQKKKNIKQNELIPVNAKRVKFVKVIYDEFFNNGDSNFKDNMQDMTLNLDIQRAVYRK